MKKTHVAAVCLALSACGGSGSDSDTTEVGSADPVVSTPPSEVSPSSPVRPTVPDPIAWTRYYVSSFDEEVVAAVRRTAAFADHAIRGTLRMDGHPVLGGAGLRVDMNPFVEAGIEYAHAVGLTGAGQILSMLDSAPMTTHEQFAGKTFHASGSGPADSHGTAVASIMVGIGAGTMTGVAPGADLHYGVLDFNNGTPFSDLARSMRDARSLGAVASNNSWGLPTVTAANTDLRSFFNAPGRADYVQSLREFSETGVIVFAAGNDCHATSVSGIAALPSAFPELEGTWITVVNAIPEVSDGAIVSATRVSTACLEAARWCITANGQVRAASTSSDRGYDITSGTSFSAPQVNGSIGLLAEAFPTLTAGQLRDRLLATANNTFYDHTGSVEFAPGIVRGYNEEFGLGFLDVRAALLPIGAHVIPLHDGRTRSFSEVAVISGSASGDALTKALEDARIISLDGLHGVFETDARHLAGVAAPSDTSTAALLARAASAAPFELFERAPAHALAEGVALPAMDLEAGRVRLITPIGDSSLAGVSLSRDIAAARGAVMLGLNFGRHNDSLMGLQVPSRDGDLSGYSVSAVMGLDLGLRSSRRIGIETEAGFASGKAAGMIEDFRGLRFNSVRARYAEHDMLRRGDRLTLSVARPLAMTSGTAEMILPVGFSNGRPVFSPVGLDLAPSSRQMDLAVEYSLPIAANAAVRAGAMYSWNHGHVANARNATAVLGAAISF